MLQNHCGNVWKYYINIQKTTTKTSENVLIQNENWKALQLQIEPPSHLEDNKVYPVLFSLICLSSVIYSSPESKANVVKAIRCVLRENAKRSAPAERGFRDNLTFPRRSHQATVRSRSWTKTLQPEEGRLLAGDTHSEPGIPRNACPSLGSGTRLGSLTSSLEAQLQRLSFTEEVPQEGRGRNSSHMTTMGNTSDMDVSSMLVRDYSVQSLNSAVNDANFYDTVIGVQKAAIPTL